MTHYSKTLTAIAIFLAIVMLLFWLFAETLFYSDTETIYPTEETMNIGAE